MVAEEEEEEEAEAERAAARAGGAMSREEHQPAAPLQAGCRAHGAPFQARVAAAAAGVAAGVGAAAGAKAAADHPRRGETHPLKSRGGWLAGWTEEAEIEKKKIQIMQKPN